MGKSCCVPSSKTPKRESRIWFRTSRWNCSMYFAFTSAPHSWKERWGCDSNLRPIGERPGVMSPPLLPPPIVTHTDSRTGGKKHALLCWLRKRFLPARQSQEINVPEVFNFESTAHLRQPRSGIKFTWCVCVSVCVFVCEDEEMISKQYSRGWLNRFSIWNPDWMGSAEKVFHYGYLWS